MSTELSTSSAVARWFKSRLWTSWFPERCRPLKSVLANLLFRLVWTPVAWPLTFVTSLVSTVRLMRQSSAPEDPARPVLAVGNWIVGGAGKTPTCLAFAIGLAQSGWRPGILSRGAGRVVVDDAPRILLPDALGQWSPEDVGDEPWLLAWRSNCPVAVAADRWAAAQALLAVRPEVNLFILDDGLSQTSIRPHVRVLVIDDRLHGNGWLLPLGPLRQSWPPSSEHLPDFVVLRDGAPVEGVARLIAPIQPPPEIGKLGLMSVALARPRREGDRIVSETVEFLDAAREWRIADDRPVVALAGIARPDPFFDYLRRHHVRLVGTACLDDHAPAALLEDAAIGLLRPLAGQAPVLLMTEKDAVKFFARRSFEHPDLAGVEWWAVAQRHRLFEDSLLEVHNRLKMRHGLQTS